MQHETGRFRPDLVRRSVWLLPGCAKNWEFRITIFPWNLPEHFRPPGHRVRAPLLVRVFEDRGALRAACGRLEKRWAKKASGDNYVAMVVPTPRATGRGKNRRLSRAHPFAVMLLLRRTIDPEIIAHESLHAASSYFRALQWIRGKGLSLDLGPCGGFPREERLAYLAGHFAGEIHSALAQHRIWSRP